MKKKNIKASLASLVLLLILAACSILQPNNNLTQADQAQISALETQNALLLGNQDQISALETQNAILLANQNANQPSPQNTPGSLQVPAAPTSAPVSALPTNPPVVETLPTEPVPAGQPISYDGWVLTVDPNISMWENGIRFRIIIRNLWDTSRIFRYQNDGLILSDNLGNIYKPGEYCYIEDLRFPKNREVKGEESVEITSDWNSCADPRYIQEFEGPIALNAKQLILRFEKFGPFDNVEVFFDL